MAQKRESLERQLELAKQSLANYESRRTSQVDVKKDPQWRQLDAKRRDIATRLHRVGQAEQLKAELAARHADD